MSIERTELRLPIEAVHGTLYEQVDPAMSDPGAGVVVISGSGGGDRMSTAMARALVASGAAAAALGIGYFKVPGRPDELRDIELEYFAGAAEAVRSRCPSGAALVVLGASRGSEAALLAAVHFPGLVDAVVGVVPADAAFGSWPPGGAAWTLGGEPVPLAAIAIERFGGPVLLVSAGRDDIWPSAQMASSLAARLGDQRRSCEHLHYPEATHALSFLAPVDDATADPADVAARDDAWPRVLAFVRSALPARER